MNVLGFRETYGGLHLKYKVNQILLYLEKEMIYAITAILGTKIMEKSENSFVSSTFGRKELDLR